MLESLGTLVVTSCSAALYGYWMFWAFAVMTADANEIDRLLDHHYRRLRAWTMPSPATALLRAPFIQWLDRCAMMVCYQLNRPLCYGFGYTGPEDAISALGRFGFAGPGPLSWSLCTRRGARRSTRFQ